MRKAAVTVNRPQEEVERLWQSSQYQPEYVAGVDAAVSFRPASGGRGTEIHVDLGHEAPGGKLGEVVQKLFGGDALAKVKDDLRRFKAHVETGVIPRSEGSPEGERPERKLKQRPAQPLSESELQEVGVR
jgi:uncharacterized membrane protein